MKKIKLLCLFGLFFSCTSTSNAQTKVTFYTDMGNFVIDLYDTLQPITTGNFKTLVNNKFYDSLIIHRVVPNFVIQAGDPWGPLTGPGWTIPDEFDPATSNVQKAVSMANAGPNTGGSQFFVNLVNNLSLDADYPVFGMVSSGFNIVQAIGGVPTDNVTQKPLNDIFIDSARITAFPTSVSEWQHNKRLQFEIYPQPVTQKSILSIASDIAQNADFYIIDLFGVVHHHQQKHLLQGISRLAFNEMNTGKLAAGIYFLVIKDTRKVYTQKVMIAH